MMTPSHHRVPLVLSGTLDGAMVWELPKPTTARSSAREAKVGMMLYDSTKKGFRYEFAGRDAQSAAALRDGPLSPGSEFFGVPKPDSYSPFRVVIAQARSTRDF